ncbi:UNVERIFIED_CONTAM: Quinolinate synthase, chloroplastic [Sesamum indicum]
MDSAALSFGAVSSSFFCNSRNPKFSCVSSNPKPASPPIVRCSQSENPHLNSWYPLKPISGTAFSCTAVTSHHTNTSGSGNLTASTAAAAATTRAKLQLLIQEFQSLTVPLDRVKRLLHYAELLRPLGDSLKSNDSRVPGCTAQVWLHVELDDNNKLRFLADSDSEITKGFCACLVWVLDGATPEEVLAVKTEDLAALSVVGLNRKASGYSSSRANTWHNVLMSMQKRTKALVAEREGRPRGEPFPSLIVSAEGIQAKGSYAEAQARFLLPDEVKIQELVNFLEEKKIGVVAHFYMDPEVQGVLTAAQKLWPHIHISDSLVMADSAVKMAKAGCKFITVLGVDFMSENVRAILDQAGFPEVGVYRMSDERIGCSLADAAASPAYMDYLAAAAASVSSPSLHVVYINTSLETKAYTHEVVPTITCTSSNVVQTILQAFSEVPDLNVWYGPDTYMGANIMELFRQMTAMSDEEIAEIHPKHNRNSIKSLIPRLHYFQDGTCIVHHLFGHEVVGKINEMYCDAFLTAHFEVPGEMFSLAMEAKRRGMGVVGSTQNILDFIKERLQEALDRNVDDHLQFVLGTESGMVTSIVAAVRKLLGSVKSHDRAKVSVEIVFPVSSESITTTPSSSPGEAGDFLKFPVIPGVASGEGCSLHGGCASCPYMKMNSLESLLKVCRSLPHDKENISAYEAGRFSLQTPNGKLIADVGCEPILHMRHFQVHVANSTSILRFDNFQATKQLPEKLIQQILGINSE